MKRKQRLTEFQGSAHFRQRIVLAVLSKKPIRISNIRNSDGNSGHIGLKPFESKFLQLVSALTNDTVVSISDTGTEVYFEPGGIVGGKRSFDCGSGRSVGYFLEGIITLCPFSTAAVNLKLTGITNDDDDISVDVFRTVTLPTLQRFGLSENLEFKILARGAPPGGKGKVQLICPGIKKLNSVQLTEVSKVKRVRGIAYGVDISPSITNRLALGAKEYLLKFTGDVFVYTDHWKRPKTGSREKRVANPGFGVALVAESLDGNLISGEAYANKKNGRDPTELGKLAAARLLQQVLEGGCVDACMQSLALTFMVLAPAEVSKLRIGKMTKYTVGTLRLLKQMFDVTFKLESDEKTDTIVCTCLGSGYHNIYSLKR